MLDAIGVGARLAGQGCPIRQIRVSDGLEPGALDFVPDADDGALGTMYENSCSRRALFDAASAAPAVDLRMQTRATDGRARRGGRDRDAERRRDRSARRCWSPRRGAIRRRARRPGSTSRAGATITPRSSARSTTSATARGHRVRDLLSRRPVRAAAAARRRDRASFRDRLDGDAKDAAGDAQARRPRRSWPRRRSGWAGSSGTLSAPIAARELSARLPPRRADHRASGWRWSATPAHGIHPIAGQGLNLGFRDVATLVEVLVEGKRLGLDLGDAALLARYQRWRGLDTFMVAAATDSADAAVRHPRQDGERGAAVRHRRGRTRSPPLKDRFMAEARGESGDLPKLLQGLTV